MDTKTYKQNRTEMTKGKAAAPVGRLLKTSEAAEAWNVSKWAIYRWVKEGRLKPFKGFKEWRFLESDINRVLERL